MNDEIIRTGRTLQYEGTIVDVYRDEMQFPNGNKEQWDFVAHRKGAACVLPVLKNGHVLMVRQARPSIERVTLEIPAGSKNFREEPSILCAARELEEETGYHSDELTLLCQVATTPAFCNEFLDVFLAKNLVKTTQHLDENEYLNVEEWDIQELIPMIYDGRIVDSKTCVALLTYYTKVLASDSAH